jgi:methyltransferase (TIGR00027 family)
MADFPPVLKTALWLAGARVLETKKWHPLVKDPFAEGLLGTEGLKTALKLERTHPVPREVIRRIRLIDDLVLRLVKELKIEVVIMAGTGLDARPYRLDLPKSLTWIEVDYPVVTQWKDLQLKDKKPNCTVERVGMNLVRPWSLDTAIGDKYEGKRTLILAENLFQYFSTYDTQQFYINTKCFGQGTVMIADLPNSSFASSALGQQMSAELEKREVGGRTAIDDIPAFMKHVGYKILETYHVPCLNNDPASWKEKHHRHWWMPKRWAQRLSVVVAEKE